MPNKSRLLSGDSSCGMTTQRLARKSNNLASHCCAPKAALANGMRHLSVQPSTFVVTLLCAIGLCANLAASSPTQSDVRVQQCREGCFEKFAIKQFLCQQNSECLTCWDECAKPPPPKISKSIRETWSLHTVSMLQQDSLVLVDVAWAPLSTPNQCLVTWEVSGGGLMGNLLTESYNVQLSLWPDTKYRVQVTCKNKLTGSMSRSMPLTIDTAEAINTQIANEKQLHPKQITASTPQLPIAKIPSTSNVNEISNSITDSIVTSIEQDNTNVLPYDDDQSAETINQHTNFIFNWHTKNSDISAIEPLHKPNLNILTIAALSDLQKPLLFGVIAGTLLLALILLLYVCMLRQQRVPNDKAALIEEDVHSVVVSMPPAAATANATATATTPTTYRTGEEMCKNAAFCSRNALKV